MTQIHSIPHGSCARQTGHAQSISRRGQPRQNTQTQAGNSSTDEQGLSNPVTRSAAAAFVVIPIALAQQAENAGDYHSAPRFPVTTETSAGVDFGNAQALPMPTPVLSPPTADDAVLQARNAKSERGERRDFTGASWRKQAHTRAPRVTRDRQISSWNRAWGFASPRTALSRSDEPRQRRGRRYPIYLRR